MKLLAEKLGTLANYSQENLEDVFKNVMDQTGLKLGKIAQPVRLALTGKTASPGIFEIIAILGPERVIPRLERAIQYIEGLDG
jgi:glutamyl-tRNA synthetase